jgi:hypothetical protein
VLGGQTKLEKIVMAETTRRPVTGTQEEFSKGGERSVLTFGVVATGLILLLVLFGLDVFNLSGSKHVAPQPIEPPATSGSQSQ